MLITNAEREVLRTMHKTFNMGFLSHHSIEPDELHCIYLGIAGYFLGRDREGASKWFGKAF